MCTNPLLPSENASDIFSMCAGIENNTNYVAGQLEDMFRCARLGVDPWSGCVPDVAASASLVPLTTILPCATQSSACAEFSVNVTTETNNRFVHRWRWHRVAKLNYGRRPRAS